MVAARAIGVLMDMAALSASPGGGASPCGRPGGGSGAAVRRRVNLLPLLYPEEKS